MKEFKAQMLHEGRWVTAHKPFGPLHRPRTNRQDVVDFIARCDEAWKEAYQMYDFIEEVPKEYRIVSREVSDWEAEESV